MANGSDGSIIIDTELDNEGFERGSGKLLKAVQDLTGAIDNLGDNMMGSFSKVIPLLQNIAGSAASVNAAIEGTATQAANAGDSVAQAEQHIAQAAQAAQQAVGQQGQGMSALAADAAKAQTGAASLEREIQGLANGLTSLSRNAQSGFSTANAVLSFDNKLSDMQAKLDAAREKLEAFAQLKIPTDDYIWLQNAIQKVEQEYDRLIERQDKMRATGVKETSKAWQALEYQIARNREMLNEYKVDMAALEENGGAYQTGAQTEQYARMVEQIQQVEAALERNKALIDQEALAQARLNVEAAQEAVITAQNADEREAAMDRLRAAQQELNDLAASMTTKGTEPPPEETLTGWQRFAHILGQAGAAAIRVTGALAKVSFGAIGKGVKSLTSKLRQFVSQSRKSRTMADSLVKSLTSLKRMLLTRVKRMFISAIFNGIKDALKSLALFSDVFNAAMSNIKNSSKQMGANISVSIGNLLAAVEPVLTRIINLISTAISYLNALFALLGGKSTVTVAKKQTADYADALHNAAGGAAELKKQVYSFDELNRRSSDSGGGGGGSMDDLFEDVPIADLLPDAVNEFFDRLKTAFENGDWYGFGNILAEGFNDAFTVIDDWINDKARPWLKKWAGRIAEALNGVTDGLKWEMIGQTLSDGFETVLETVYTFLTTYNFLHLGQGIARAINSFIERTDFSLIGRTIGSKLRAAIEFAFGLVSTLDFTGIGEKIAQAINGFFERMGEVNPETGMTGWQELGATIARSLNGLKDIIVAAIQNINWAEVRKALGDAISTFLTEADVEVKIALGCIITALTINKISKILFGQGVLALAGKGIASKLSKGFAAGGGAKAAGSGILSGLWAKITTLAGTSIGEAGLGASLGAALLGAIGGGITGKLIDNHIIGPLIDKLGGDHGLAEAFRNFKWFGDGGAFDTIGQAFSDYFSTYKFGDITGYWLDQLGIKKFFGETVPGAWGDFTGWVSNSWNHFTGWVSDGWNTVSGGLSTTWDNIKSTASGAWENVKTTISDKITNAKTKVNEAATNIRTSISTAWNDLKTKTSTIWNNIKSTATTAFENAKTKIITNSDNIKSSLTTAWENLKSTASLTWEDIKSKALSSWDELKSSAVTKWENIKTSISDKWSELKSFISNTDWASIGTDVVNGLKNGIVNSWYTLKQRFEGLVGSLITDAKNILGISSPSKEFESIGLYTDEGLDSGLMKGKKAILATIKSIADGMTNGMNGVELPDTGYATGSLLDGLDAITAKLSAIANVFRAITDSILAMGDLRVPQIAAGTVVPPKTRVAIAATENPLTGDFSTFSSDVDERMADQTYVLRQILTAIRALNLNIDIDALTRMITKQQRERSLNFGGV